MVAGPMSAFGMCDKWARGPLAQRDRLARQV
jgi:hypothetical protein